MGLAVSLLAVWALGAYVVAPRLWKRYFGRHGDLAAGPRITHAADGHPGDPLNLGLVGTDEQVVRAMTAIAWFPADPITFRSSIRIAVDCVFRKPDESADTRPVWFGSATFDERVGLSHTTAQVTHHIAPDVDAERDRIARDLLRASSQLRWLDGFQQSEGRNGGSDTWRSDSRFAMIVLAPTLPSSSSAPRTDPVRR